MRKVEKKRSRKKQRDRGRPERKEIKSTNAVDDFLSSFFLGNIARTERTISVIALGQAEVETLSEKNR